MPTLLRAPRVHVVMVVVWVGLIFLCSTEPAMRWAYGLYDALLGVAAVGGSAEVRLVVQKLFHVFLFVVLSWLLAALPAATKTRRILICALGCVTVGALSEGVQFLVSGRGPTAADVVINGLSGTLSSFLWVR